MRLLFSFSCLVLFLVQPVSGATYLVKPDGMGDFPTIQDAIDAAVPGDIVELADGTFTGPGNRELDYLGKAITVRSQSGQPENCVIDLEGTIYDGYRGFHFHHGEDHDADDGNGRDAGRHPPA